MQYQGGFEMNKTIRKNPILHGKLKCAVYLVALLASVNALAETPSSDIVLAHNDGCHATAAQTPLDGQPSNCQPADPYEAIKWRNATRKPATVQNAALSRKSTYTKSSKSVPVDTRRAFKDDYERVLTTVGNAKNTQMIWLRSN
jgi:hypothetical protein